MKRWQWLVFDSVSIFGTSAVVFIYAPWWVCFLVLAFGIQQWIDGYYRLSRS